ncbi:MAG: HAMP domain-containing histidine kinase [Clostridia bacterium]|nr:HAMP domain-containing histidine kinase [Clostridia bacterium]
MIDKLRKRIFWIIQISLSIIILGVIIIFTNFSYKNTITSSTMFIDRLDGRNEIRGEKPKELSETKNNDDPFVVNIDGVYKFEINSNSNIIRESDNVTNEVRQYALEISNKSSEEGYVGNYIYKTRKVGNDNKEITLMENENAINRLKTTIIFAIVIGALGIIIIYIIARKIAQVIVKPVEETFEKQKQFISDASHELKTPLAVIEANADVLGNKIGENKWIEYIQNEVQSMNKLVNDLLTLARIGNTNTVNNQKFNLSKEVQMAVAVFESIIFENKIDLETNINENIEFTGDKDDIKHIISILLDNAIKHTAETKKIIVNVEKEKNEIKIEVKNQGEEIPKEEQSKIFERFYRIDKSRNRNEKRYGLGLPIAKELVGKYKGSIMVSCKEGFTSFIVKLMD